MVIMENPMSKKNLIFVEVKQKMVLVLFMDMQQYILSKKIKE
jgi:hypothetical protein